MEAVSSIVWLYCIFKGRGTNSDMWVPHEKKISSSRVDVRVCLVCRRKFKERKWKEWKYKERM